MTTYITWCIFINIIMSKWPTIYFLSHSPQVIDTNFHQIKHGRGHGLDHSRISCSGYWHNWGKILIVMIILNQIISCITIHEKNDRRQEVMQKKILKHKFHDVEEKEITHVFVVRQRKINPSLDISLIFF